MPRSVSPGPAPPAAGPRAPVPPDNIADLQPCVHLTSVLDTKAHSTVKATYQQAVAIYVALHPVLSKEAAYEQRKDGSAVAPARLAEYKQRVLRCTQCGAHNHHSVFICLQCPHVGCYHRHAHAHAHAKKSAHVFAIDSRNGLLYCFSCGTYVNHGELNRIRVAAVAPPGAAAPPGAVPGYRQPSLHAAHGLKGIVNLGATCFMSCVLQTMLHNPLVRHHFFHSDFHFFNCASQRCYSAGEDVIDATSACITCSIDSTFKEFFTSASVEGYGITNLLTTAWHRNRSLAGFQEQDAHEFWQFLLNEFHGDYERVCAHAGVSPTPCRCVMHTVFSGELESSVVCSNCDVPTNTVDPLVDLSLEINHSMSLYDCLDRFTRDEPLDVKYRCRACRMETKAHRSLKIKTLPPVLSIQLKRFKHNFANDTASKIEDKVDVPPFLNLTAYCSDAAAARDPVDHNKVYELFAMVHHTGSVNTGHYIAFVKSSTGQWYRFDDSVVSYVSWEEVKATNAYLLFYIAHNI